MTSDIFSKAYLSFKEQLKFCLLVSAILVILVISYVKLGLTFNYYSEWSHKYTLEDFFEMTIFEILFSYISAVSIVFLHNRVILQKRNILFFSKSIFKYFLFLFVVTTYNGIIYEFMYAWNSSFGYFLFIPYIFIGLFMKLLAVLLFLWVLYLPNMATEHKYSLFFMIKNSKGFRLIIVYLILICLGIAAFCRLFILVPIIGSYIWIFLFSLIVLFATCMFSHTYLLWEESLNLSEVNNK